MSQNATGELILFFLSLCPGVDPLEMKPGCFLLCGPACHVISVPVVSGHRILPVLFLSHISIATPSGGRHAPLVLVRDQVSGSEGIRLRFGGL
ncbi:hypothetical protein EYF80_049800 [Liparis tanakae]|uniref:Secreted protein n=1 Tax=Liparis tanakae TaxID=230148 RepID=A0A4Z2FFU8_9TELE|nr:hypothetical protein EYF80_049800 [Liparis tanakae]